MALYKKVAHICGFHLHVEFKYTLIIWKRPEYSENSMDFPQAEAWYMAFNATFNNISVRSISKVTSNMPYYVWE